MTVSFALLDTNVYIDHWERGAHGQTLALVQQALIVRHSSVVLSELRRGARTTAAKRLVQSLRSVATTIWTPQEHDWWMAGELIGKIGDRRGWATSKRRDFQNDALIALTARRHGATIVTSNRLDFELLAAEFPFRLWTL